jgi:hypothetical protein
MDKPLEGAREMSRGTKLLLSRKGETRRGSPGGSPYRITGTWRDAVPRSRIFRNLLPSRGTKGLAPLGFGHQRLVGRHRGRPSLMRVARRFMRLLALQLNTRSI